MLDPYLSQLATFSNVQTLVITNLVTPSFNAGALPICFGLTFPQVLSLRLLNPFACPISLLRFILAFPRISNLEVQHPRWTRDITDDNSTLALRDPNVPPLDGRLCLVGLGEKFEEFTSQLAMQGMKFRRFHLLRCGFTNGFAMHSFLDALRGTLTILTVAPLEGGERVV